MLPPSAPPPPPPPPPEPAAPNGLLPYPAQLAAAVMTTMQAEAVVHKAELAKAAATRAAVAAAARRVELAKAAVASAEAAEKRECRESWNGGQDRGLPGIGRPQRHV